MQNHEQATLKFNGRLVKSLRIVPNKKLGSYVEAEDYLTGQIQRVTELVNTDGKSKLDIIHARQDAA